MTGRRSKERNDMGGKREKVRERKRQTYFTRPKEIITHTDRHRLREAHWQTKG